MAELLLGVPAPILYWEQGHEWLFGDPVRFQVESNPPFSPWTPRLTARWSRLSVSPAVGTRLSAQAAHNYLEQDQLFHMAMHLPVALASVSTAVQDILKQEFRRESLLLPNSIDCERFRPGPKSGNWALAGVPAKKRKVPPPPPQVALRQLSLGFPLHYCIPYLPQLLQTRPCPALLLPQVLLVGNPTLQLKGFDVAIAVLQAVNCVIPIHVTWICQVEPTVATLPALAAATFEMTYVVKPKQVSRQDLLGSQG